MAMAAVCFSLSNTEAAPPRLELEFGVNLSWSSTVGNSYTPQWANDVASSWNDLGSARAGDGTTQTQYDPSPSGKYVYRVLEVVPAVVVTSIPVNGGFESGTGTTANGWTATAGQPPSRSSVNTHTGTYSMRSVLNNVTAASSEGGLNQSVLAQGGSVVGGKTYQFSFWAYQVSAGSSYVQQYRLDWLNSAGGYISGTGLQNFSGGANSWAKISGGNLVAPITAADARVSFRFVTGAISGDRGEVYLDDVLLDSGNTSVASITRIISSSNQAVAKISWPSVLATEYQPAASTTLAAGSWTNIPPLIVGDGGIKSITVPITREREFYRLGFPLPVVSAPTLLRTTTSGITNAIGLAWTASSTTGVDGYRVVYGPTGGSLTQSIEVGNLTTATLTGLTAGQTYDVSVVALTAEGQSPAGQATLSALPEADLGMVALYNTNTVLEPATTVETSTARTTYLADRARDRHAREGNFHIYDHYLSWYWEQRVANIEIIDRVAKGGSDITFNFTTLAPLNPAEFRAFYRGIGTVAEYHYNAQATLVSTNASATAGETDYHYTAQLTSKWPENRPLQLGDRVEVEISQFLLAPRNGRSNYYGTVFLYVVGQGVIPWYGVGDRLDSFPLPQSAWLGGLTTLPYQYSNEPEHRFKQMAGNISPTNGQTFMLGRRLHHTDFKTGEHSEPDNPVFTSQIGKVGPKFVAQSCVECHVNNGRALPPDVGAPLIRSVVKVGSDASGSPHPILGSELQPKSITGTAEGAATLASYTTTSGTYGDGTAYSLRKPNYSFQGVTPSFYSVRVAPPLVGLGLLEAVSESTLQAIADPDDANHDGISGKFQIVNDPETHQRRLGRFTYKASQARVVHQIAYALNNDMGVASAIFPVLDGETTARPAEISATELDQMNRYVSLLGVGARRDFADTEALRGETLFATASCTSCHSPSLPTSAYHPMAELRSQTIHPFSDLLLHDMGAGLADNMGEDGATGAEWRTSPLWNIGLTAGVSGGEAYLHDGRARTLEEAILWHGGEANAAKESFRTMPTADRAAIIKFLKSL